MEKSTLILGVLAFSSVPVALLGFYEYAILLGIIAMIYGLAQSHKIK